MYFHCIYVILILHKYYINTYLKFNQYLQFLLIKIYTYIYILLNILHTGPLKRGDSFWQQTQLVSRDEVHPRPTIPPPPSFPAHENKQRVINDAKSLNQSAIMGLKKLMSGLDLTGKRDD